MRNGPVLQLNLTWLTVSLLLGTTIFIQVMVSAWFYNRQRTLQYHDLTVELQQIGDQAKRNLASALWNLDTEQIQQIVDNYMLLPSLSQMVVLDGDGTMLVDRRKKDGASDRIAPITTTEQSRYRQQLAILHNNEPIGTLEIALSTAQTQERLHQYLLSVLATILVVALVQIATLYVLFRRTLIQPLQALSAFAGAIGSRQKPNPTPPQGIFIGELANLRDSILGMVADLSASEKKYRMIFEHSLEGIFQVSFQGRFIKANPALAEMLGHEAPDLLIAAIKDIDRQLYVDDRQHPLMLQRIQAGEQITNEEVLLRHRDGHQLHCLMSMRAVGNETGAMEYLEGALIDISARKKAEQELAALNRELENLVVQRTAQLNLSNGELKSSEERYRNLVESMQEGILLLDKEDRLTYTNPQMAAMLGVETAELMGTQCARFLNAQNQTVFESHIKTAQGKQNIKFEVSFTRPDGQTISTLVTPTTVFDQTGRYDGAFAVVTDISNMKQLQAQLLQAQKLESIGQLAAGIAHEINTPTQYVIHNVKFLQDATNELIEFLESLNTLIASAKEGRAMEEAIRNTQEEKDRLQPDVLVPEISEAFRDIFEGLGRIAGIVSSVKRFAQPDQEVASLTDLNETIESAVIVSGSQWRCVARVETDLAPDLPKVPCVPAAIDQVLLNLIVNAAHAIGEANRPDLGLIRIESRQLADRVQIRITDSGPGIALEIQERIFDPFFTTKEVGSGSGQGLAIARKIIVDSHRGSLDFETEVGVGTTFVITLPLS